MQRTHTSRNRPAHQLRPWIRAIAGAECIALTALLFAVPGCGQSPSSSRSDANAPESPLALRVSTPATSPGGEISATRGAPSAADPATAIPAALPRKIIFNAQLQLVVDDVATLGKTLTALVKESAGYISETNLTSYTRQSRQATWKIRVPVEHFDALIEKVAKLGEVQQNQVDSQDVSQEYYDLDANITNKQQEEKRLLKHLSDSTGKLEDILAVEREISRVRGEIERMQGRLRFLAHQTSLSTVTVVASEVRDYVPPVQASFLGQVQGTFQRSISALVDTATAIALFSVLIAPWLPFLFLIGLVLAAITRRRNRRTRSSAATT